MYKMTKKIQVQTLDSYYNDVGQTHDISEFIDTSKSNVNFAIHT